MKLLKRSLLACSVLTLVALAVVLWHTAGIHRAVHTEVRTAYMDQLEQLLSGGVLTRSELRSNKIKVNGVTLHRAAYYPQAKTLICFLENADPHRDIYLESQPERNGGAFPERHGISYVYFEHVSPADLSGSLIVDLTDWDFETSNPVALPLSG